MLKKTIVAGGMLVAAAAGTLLTGMPVASAAVPTWGGCSTCSSSSFGHFTRNRSWNGNENENFNHIRLRIHNRNNNIAVADDRSREIV